MVTVGMSYPVQAGKEADFEQVFQAVRRALEEMPEHLQTRFYRACGESDYLILSEWTCRQAYEDFARSKLFRKIMTWSHQEVLRRCPSYEVYEGAAPREPLFFGAPTPSPDRGALRGV